MTAGGGVDAAVEAIIARVGRENSIDGMDGDSWDRLLVRAAIADTSKRFAELIAADKAFDLSRAALIEVSNRITAGSRSDDDFRKQANAQHSYDRATARRASALAAVGQQS